MPGNANFDQIAATTLKAYRPTLIDNVFLRTPFFFWMMQKGRKETLDGGDKIVVPVIASKNTTAGGYSGYQALDVTPQENESAAEYVWAQYYATVAISGRQERQNSGSKTKIINLLDAKVKNAEMAVKDKMDTDLFSNTLDSASKLNGMQALIDQTSNVGGINRSTAGNEFWQAQLQASVGSFATNGIDKMRTLYNTCTDDGNDTPDLGITTRTVYEAYEKTLQTQQRFTDSKTLDGGFENLKFKGMVLMYDSKVVSGELYMLNSAWLKLQVHPDADMELTPFVKPSNQDAKVAQYLFMGNVVLLQSRRHGKLTGITTP